MHSYWVAQSAPCVHKPEEVAFEPKKGVAGNRSLRIRVQFRQFFLISRDGAEGFLDITFWVMETETKELAGQTRGVQHLVGAAHQCGV